jgi:hypothetical protein
MEKAFNFDTIAQYNAFNNHETLHPMVSVIDFSKANERTGSRMTFGLYGIILKEIHCGDLKYGCNHYDYEEGTLVFIAPGQVIDVENKVDYYQPVGHGLLFHRHQYQNQILFQSRFYPEKMPWLHLKFSHFQTGHTLRQYQIR